LTTIDVCLSLYPWAPFERSRGAVKMHTLLDLRGSIPTFIDITHGRSHDVFALDRIAQDNAPGSPVCAARVACHVSEPLEY
jgi:hypothetical protein